MYNNKLAAETFCSHCEVDVGSYYYDVVESLPVDSDVLGVA